MPRGDGTGPAGRGPMTGRAAGYCAGYSVPGYMNPVPGRGGAWRRGFGGIRQVPGPYQQQFVPGTTPNYGQGYYGYGQQSYSDTGEVQKQELAYLKDTEKAIEEELDAVKKRIEEIESDLEE